MRPKNPIKQQKDAVREKYRPLRRDVPDDVRRARDGAILDRVRALVSYRHADTVLLYAPMADEVDVMPLAKDAWASGKRVAFPRCHDGAHTMDFHIVSSEKELLPGAFGLSEPPPDAPIYNFTVDTGSAICIIPGLVFDRGGYRVGYGRGYYDRYLSAFPGSKVGVVHHDFLLPAVPRGRFDLAVDIVLTDRERIFTKT